MKTNNKSIIYVNFAPYENAGKILDFILSHFHHVVVFAFNFHRLSKTQAPSTLTVFHNGKIILEKRLFQTPTPASLAFILLPIRSLTIFLQILWHTWNLKLLYGPFDIYFTVNAFTAWSGNILRSLGFVKKTIFWIWDYYPPIHENSVVMFMRRIYWRFDTIATQQTDHIVFLNRHLKTLRQKLCLLPKYCKNPIVEIGTNPVSYTRKINRPKHIQIVFLGVIKKIQGLDIFFQSAQLLAELYPDLTLHVIGGGPDYEYFREKANQSPLKVVFHGYINNENIVDTIIRKCHVGIAPYVPDKSNCMYFSDPSKIKRYINFGLPVITTNVFDFSKDIKKMKAGIIIPYDSKAFVKAIYKIISNYPLYQAHAIALSKRYRYTVLYKKIFTVQ